MVVVMISQLGGNLFLVLFYFLNSTLIVALSKISVIACEIAIHQLLHLFFFLIFVFSPFSKLLFWCIRKYTRVYPSVHTETHIDTHTHTHTQKTYVYAHQDIHVKFAKRKRKGKQYNKIDIRFRHLFPSLFVPMFFSFTVSVLLRSFLPFSTPRTAITLLYCCTCRTFP